MKIRAKVKSSNLEHLLEIRKLQADMTEIVMAKEKTNELIREIQSSNQELSSQADFPEKLELLEQSRYLELRIKELASNLTRLEDLGMKVRTKILELKALYQSSNFSA